MENEDWQEIVVALVDAKRALWSAWCVLDGTDGAADGVEDAFHGALETIDEIYAIESRHAANADVASPPNVQKYWEGHGELPGFGVGALS